MTTLLLYNYNGHPNTIQKSLGDAVEVQGLHYDKITSTQCEVQLQGMYDTFNYVYMKELDRYYFVESSRIEQTGVVRLFITLDPLMTYADNILNARATSVKSVEYNGLSEDTPKHSARQSITTMNFDDALNHEGDIVLITIKGK